MVDVRQRGQRVLLGNLGVSGRTLAVLFGLVAGLGELAVAVGLTALGRA
jgi:hypothetical protein